MEQYMMFTKAEIFGDVDAMSNIINNPGFHPAEHKKMGRTVRNFNEATWDRLSMRVVVMGNLCKFTQNFELRDILMSTIGKMLVGSSPTDRIWGIGYDKHNAMANMDTWGQNKLGKALMLTRNVVGNSLTNMIMEPFTMSLEFECPNMNSHTNVLERA